MRLLILLAFSLVLSASLSGQNCQGNPNFTTPFIHPANDSIPCIARNVPYSSTLTIYNFDSVQMGMVNVIVDSLSIDSILNLPCGISWLGGKAPNNTYLAHERGCILLAGTTGDSVGQYRLGIRATIYSGSNATVVDLDTFGVKKYLRVIDSIGAVCAAIDTSIISQIASCQGITVNVVGHTQICQGDGTGLTAFVQNGNGHYTYLWSTGDTTFLLGVNQAGVYSVTVSDGSWTASASNTVRIDSVVVPSVVVYPDPLYSLDTSHYYCGILIAKTDTDFASKLTASQVNGGSNPHYQWLLNGQPTSVTDSVFIIGGNSEIIANCLNQPCLLVCKLTSSIGCARPNTAFSIPDTIIYGCPWGAINELSIDQYIGIYPNPNNGKFVLSSYQASLELMLELRDMQGPLLYTEQQKGITNLKKELDFSSLAKGIYLLKVTTENGVAVKRIVIQ